MSGKGNPIYMSTFKNYLNFVKSLQATMKTKLLLMSFVLSLCMSTTSCIVTRHHHRPPHKKEIPPGHAKKIHGHKSAKFDAPGHHKH